MPTISVSSGPTTVPQRVTHASSVACLGMMRFMTLTSASAAISASWRSQSAFDEMKKVVCPLSP